MICNLGFYLIRWCRCALMLRGLLWAFAGISRELVRDGANENGPLDKSGPFDRFWLRGQDLNL